MILDKSVLEIIEEIAAKYPGRVAIKSQDQSLTYGELWRRSDQLAAWLDDRLEDNKKPVMVYGHKNPQMIVCFLACVKSGRAYCPVDISMPKNRIEDIAAIIDNEVILASEPLEMEGFEVINASNVLCSDKNISREKRVKKEDVFYIIFTSGSTGKPKGVEITADNLKNFLGWSKEQIDNALKGREKNGVFLNQAPFSFDLSVMDLYNSLVSGGTLLCLEKSLQADTARMFEYMSLGRPECWVSTPSFADMCLADPRFNGEMLKDIKLFLFCGERLSKDTAGKLMERFPAAKVINTYGPTESTVAVTSVEITKDMLAAEDLLPIGIPKKGTEILFDGEEMLIAGDTVAKGYFKDREKTEKAFFQLSDSDGKKCNVYRTGDSGYFKDGYYYCTGRIDLQVKLHGYRIELGDIESNLMELPEVEQAAVVPRYDGERIRNLVAFVKAPNLESSFKVGRALRNALKEKLPAYMVPKNVVFVNEMPMTANGKLDRKKLEGSLA